MLNKLTDENLQEEIRESEKPVIVFFHVSSNTVCENFRPVVEEMASTMSSDIKFMEIDLDDEASDAVAEEFNIDSAPTLVLFSYGMLREVLQGSHKKNEIRIWITENL